MSAHVWLLWNSCVGLVPEPMQQQTDTAHEIHQDTQIFTGRSPLHFVDNCCPCWHWRSPVMFGTRAQSGAIILDPCCVRSPIKSKHADVTIFDCCHTRHNTAPHRTTCSSDSATRGPSRNEPSELLAATCRDRLGKLSDVFRSTMVRCNYRHGFPNCHTGQRGCTKCRSDVQCVTHSRPCTTTKLQVTSHVPTSCSTSLHCFCSGSNCKHCLGVSPIL